METFSMADLRALVKSKTPAELEDIVRSLPTGVVDDLVADLGGRPALSLDNSGSLVELANGLYAKFRSRPHVELLSDRIVRAVRDVESGKNRRLMVHMPPRSGKTTTTTVLSPAWILSQHPDWSIALTSHDGALARTWGRQIRRWAEGRLLGPGVAVAPDAGAIGEWETTAGGRVMSMSIREPLTGRGAKVLIVDDPHKDFVDAHSRKMRDNVWDWFLSVAMTRLEPPFLLMVVQTRWHEDDLSGRLLSHDHEGDPDDWEVIRLTALAEPEGLDSLNRAPGEPLLSPVVDETREQALQRWNETKVAVGTYNWASMYQQRPAPAKGAIFDVGWWRYWTTDPDKATDDGRVTYFSPEQLAAGQWLDSWDTAFGKTDYSSFVVGQRWVKIGAKRLLVAQQRGRWDFVETIDKMKQWAVRDDDFLNPYGRYVSLRLIEDKANGPAIISTLKKTISGIKPITPRTSKEARARSITPEIESGDVLLPLPSDGNSWVTNDFLPEMRDFPNAATDDQVDALTQALAELRDPGVGRITIPGGQLTAAPQEWRVERSLGRAVASERHRGAGPGLAATRIARRPGM